MKIPPGKWIPASDHLTPAGLDAFRARMNERKQRVLKEQSVVRQIGRKK